VKGRRERGRKALNAEPLTQKLMLKPREAKLIKLRNGTILISYKNRSMEERELLELCVLVYCMRDGGASKRIGIA
jgi:hypothetical protein